MKTKIRLILSLAVLHSDKLIKPSFFRYPNTFRDGKQNKPAYRATEKKRKRK